MIPGLVLSSLVSAALGTLLLRQVWPRSAGPRNWPITLALGTGLGAGLSSVLLFLWMLGFGPTRAFPLAETGLLAVVGLLALTRRRSTAETRSEAAGAPSRLRLVLTVAFVVMLAVAVLAFTSLLRQHPHGGWDAWMNWDLRARMFFRGGDGWQRAFSDTFPWSHPDYPPMVASLVARAWLYADRETLLGPALVAGTFTFAAVALLATGLATLRSTSQGLLGGLVLLSTPFFLLHGTSLYADVPLAFFFLATIVSLALDDRYGAETGAFALLAGLAAGMAMWTKNEGLLFTLSVAAGLVVAGWRADRTGTRRRLRLFGLGLLPCLILVVTFKLAFAPPNDLLSTLGVGRTLGRLTAPARYLTVVREYTSHISGFGANGFGSAVGVLVAYLLALGPSPSETQRRWLLAGAAGLLILLAGHFMVFVSMADELARLLRSSLDRLLLQLWPSALFLFFLAVRTPEEAGADAVTVGRQPNV